MSETKNTAHCSVSSSEEFRPRGRVKEDGELAIHPTDRIYLSLTVEQWRELVAVVALVAVVEKAITDAPAATPAEASL